MKHQVKSYLNYLKNRKTRYAVHSPLVFDFQTNVLRGKGKPSKAARKNLLSNKTTFNKNDFGAGSKKSNTVVSIDKSTKYSAVNFKFSKILFNIFQHYNPQNSLEFGTHFGLGTLSMHEGYPDGQIQTIEGCLNTAEVAKNTIEKYAIKKDNIRVLNSDFDDFIYNFNQQKKFDFVYIDGNHQKEPTLKYFEFAVNNCSEFCIVVIDDIYWSEEMTSAWKNIIEQNKYYTVDLFRFGIVFIGSHLKPQHFVLKT